MRCKRVAGEPGGAGVIEVEDNNCVEWRVKLGPSKRDPERLTGYRPIECWSANYEAGDLEFDLFEAAKEFAAEENAA